MEFSSELNRGALVNFLAVHSPLKDALLEFLAQQAEEHRRQCAAFMATVPRQHELASDYAARANELDTLWARLEMAVE